MCRGSFPHTLILTSDLPHTLIRGTHFFEGKITIKNLCSSEFHSGHFIKMTWFFKKFLLPSPGHFYTYTVIWALRPRFFQAHLRFHKMLPNTARVFSWQKDPASVGQHFVESQLLSIVAWSARAVFSEVVEMSRWKRQKFLEKSGHFYKTAGMGQCGTYVFLEWFCPRKSGSP